MSGPWFTGYEEHRCETIGISGIPNQWIGQSLLIIPLLSVSMLYFRSGMCRLCWTPEKIRAIAFRPLNDACRDHFKVG